jgi:ferredoxin
MGMGEVARLYNEQGYGREITKEEALGYLRQNEDEGLVFRVGNSQEMDFVCSCCACCCGGIVRLKRVPNPADYTSSNYRAVIDEESCSGCGTCVERCPMDAITLEDDIAKLQEKRCIGCGNCTIGCPESAISLVVKDNPEVPPLTAGELFAEIKIAREKLDRNQS